MIKRPSNLAELYRAFEFLPQGSQVEIARKFKVTPTYVNKIVRPRVKQINYAIFREAIKCLPPEIGKGLKLEFK